MTTKGNVLIMAGGTGGHVIPALSVARRLKEQGYHIHWLGSIQGIENDLVPDAGHVLHRISVTGLRGKGPLKLLFAPFSLAKALWQAWRVVQKVKPQMALGMGGFASGPGGFVCALTRVPLLIHEQNAIPGMTNRLLSRFAKPVMQAFENTFSTAQKVKTVGNPVRKSIVAIETPEQRLKDRTGPLNVLVVGGSLGAVALNEAVIQMLSLMAPQERPNIWHQTGKRNYEQVKQGYDVLGLTPKVSAFIADMSAAFSWADVVVCRAGALTVSELAAAGVASILVPYPFAVDDHQTANANYLVNQGAAWLRPQSALSADALAEDIRTLTQSREQVMAMSKAARAQAKPEAAGLVAKFCIEAIHG